LGKMSAGFLEVGFRGNVLGPEIKERFRGAEFRGALSCGCCNVLYSCLKRIDYISPYCQKLLK